MVLHRGERYYIVSAEREGGDAFVECAPPTPSLSPNEVLVCIHWVEGQRNFSVPHKSEIESPLFCFPSKFSQLPVPG